MGLDLNYNIKLNYDSSGKDLYLILKEHFLIYVKTLSESNND